MKNNSYREFHVHFLKDKKLLLIMKFTFLLLVFGFIELHANVSYSQEARVTLNLEDVSFNEVLKEIGQQT